MATILRILCAGAIALVVACPVGTTVPRADASMLCRTPTKGLVVRDVCKPKDDILTPDRRAGFGLTGPPGPSGPPGPAHGDLRLVDAHGGEVGVVTALDDYDGLATVVGQLSVPGLPPPDFFQFAIGAGGLEAQPIGCPVASLFKTADCSGQAYGFCDDFSGCSSASGAIFMRELSADVDGKACFVAGGAEFERTAFYQLSKRGTIGLTPEQATAACRAQSGQPVGPPVPFGPRYLQRCCVGPPRTFAAAPVHRIDASILGSPPFRLDQ